MKKILFFLFFFLSLACSDFDNDFQEKITCHINEKKTPSFEDIFVDVEIISLETNPKCLIDKIGKIDVFEDNFYVFDEEQQRICKFDESGRYIRDIGAIGKGPGEYILLEDFDIDSLAGHIELLSVAPPRIIVYFYFKRIFKDQVISTFIFDNEGYCLISGHKNRSSYLFTKISEGGFFPNFPKFSDGYLYSYASKAVVQKLIPEKYISKKDKFIIESLDQYSNPIILKYKLAI